MPQNDPQSGTWVNPLPTRVDRDFELIFQSLTQWLENPTFQRGITVGNGTPPTYNPTTGAETAPAPSAIISLNPITQAPSDASAPGTPSVTAVGGIRSILAYWPAVQTASGSPVAHYVAEVASDNAFGSIVQTLDPVGPVASFDNLTANTTYYVRVAAVSYAGNQGPWSATKTVTTPQVAAGDIAANTITAGSAIIGSAAISSAQIASIAANQITAGTINAQTITLGATGGTAALESANFVAGSAGWAILGDGTAQFSNVTVDGGTLLIWDNTGGIPPVGGATTAAVQIGRGQINLGFGSPGSVADIANVAVGFSAGVSSFTAEDAQGQGFNTQFRVGTTAGVTLNSGIAGTPGGGMTIALRGSAQSVGLTDGASKAFGSVGTDGTNGKLVIANSDATPANEASITLTSGNVTLQSNSGSSGSINLHGAVAVSGVVNAGGGYQDNGRYVPSYPTNWGYGVQIQGGSAVVTTNGSGDATIYYPVAFPHGLFSVVCCEGDYQGGIGIIVNVVGGGAANGFNLRAWYNGPTLNNSTIRINWFAIGY